jgi:hypothetical protein
MLPASLGPITLNEENSPQTNESEQEAECMSSSSPYAYGRVLGIFHANVICTGNGQVDSNPRRIDFLWVRWYLFKPATSPFRMDKVEFPPLFKPNSTSFVDPVNVVRACHLIPDFVRGKRYSVPNKHGTSKNADDGNDWKAYYINQCVNFHIERLQTSE